jgi:hypothetical protein
MKIHLFKIIVVISTAWVVSASCGSNSSPTDPQPNCSIAISPGTQLFAGDGGTATVTITTAASCAWSVVASAGWITLTTAAAGSGPGTVGYSVSANSNTDSRAGTLTIGGQAHTVTQQGRPATICNYEIAPANAEFGKDAGTGTLTVTAAAGCAWSASSSAPWVVVTAGSQGSGDGTVSYTVSANREIASRVATITAAGRTLTVRQSGDTGSCEYSVAPVTVTTCMPSGSVSATMTTQASCSWTVAPSASWLSIPTGSSGTGSGVITFTFSENYDAPREGIVMVRWPTPTAGQNIHVSQAGCLYAVSRNSFSLAATAGSGTFDVFQQAIPNSCGSATQDRCVWSAQADVPWITITTSMPRSGDNPVSFTVTANDATQPRIGRITVRSQIVVITQAGR